MSDSKPLTRRHGWAYLLYKRLETNHRTQIRFHKGAIAFWMLNVPAAVVVIQAFPAMWNKWGVLYVALLSLYANADTDYDAMSAAQAALHAQAAEAQTKK